jgi:thiol-disulfide isomerase/thioredoxin
MTLASTLLLALFTATNPSSDGGPTEATLLDFHADWCGPCQQMRPAVDKLSRQGYPVRKINIDQSPDLARRYGVDAVPTFIVVDGSGRVLGRTSGLQPAGELERFYLAARAKADAAADDDEPARPARPVRRTGRQPDPDADAGDRDPSDQPAPSPPVNPHPIETVVRIKVQGPHSTGFGSGTIIYSSPEESLILTCAHIFKLEGRRQQVPPSEFPHQIIIDLFDGRLERLPKGPAKVHYVESFQGRAIDYDFNTDVGLIRIRPGRQLPASRVVPTYWQPQRPMMMLTMGCSEGEDATAWHTVILNPRMKGFLQGQPDYEAIECEHAPKQGRSGGGLFTTDGYIAGVCNFAEPQGNHGLYATPRSIYALLDHNKLSALYAPAVNGSDTRMADNRRPSPSRPEARLTQIARTQSPDPEEPDDRRPAVEKGDVLLPHYSLLGIKEPVGTDGDSATAPRAASTKRVAWHPTHGEAPGQKPAARPAEADGGAGMQVEDSGTTPAAGAKAPSTRPRWRTAAAADLQAPANPGG